MSDFDMLISILIKGQAKYERFQWRGAECIHVYNDIDEVLEFIFDEFGNIIIIE